MTGLAPEVEALAQECGVATDYWDWQGRHVGIPESTVVAVLAALGHDASSPAAAAEALRERRLDRWRAVLPTCTVVRRGSTEAVAVHAPHGAHVAASVQCEDGSGVELERAAQQPLAQERLDGRLVDEVPFVVPGALPLGYHTLVARIGSATDPQAGGRVQAPLIVVPHALELPPQIERSPVAGLMVQLYATRSRRSWGFGDLGDLTRLTQWSGRDLGLDFVLVNPLHAPRPVSPLEPSPYLPTTRRFPNPLYLHVEDVPEVALLSAGDRARLAELIEAGHTLTDQELLDPDAVWRLKHAALRLLASVPLEGERRTAYQAFLEREGTELRDFAEWCAAAGDGAPSTEVVLRSQWWLDEQLAAAQAAAQESGMVLGLVHDLAVGVDIDGFEATETAHHFAAGVSVGAPPDTYNQLGQDWQQPPFHPGRLAESAYAPFRDMLRSVLRHAGGIRVDHIIGLFRLWWIPEGASPTEGTYVRCDDEALVGILLLEAARACGGRGAVVIGEDLGTVEPSVRQQLGERGVLGTSVLWFERDWSHPSQDPLAPERWRRLCLATVTTHDLPPTMGYLRGAHVDLRADLGLLERDRAEEHAVFAAERQDWLEALHALGLLPGAHGRVTDDDMLVALHAYLARTPARLRAVALGDLVGDLRPVNQPGTHREYPNWLIPMTDDQARPVLLDDVVGRADDARVRRVIAALGTVTP